MMLPRGWDRRTIVLLTFAFLFVIALNLAQAQVFDLERDRVQMAELNGLWRFHTGDDPDGKLGWADPNFDDSSWALIRSDRAWGEQGWKGYTGFAWYRLRVTLPRDKHALALFINHISTSYQLFANGRLIGQFGGLPPKAEIRNQPPQIFYVPENIVAAGQPLELAIRVWSPGPGGGGLSEAPRFGDAAFIEDWTDRQYNFLYWQFSAMTFHLPFQLLATVACLVLFGFRRIDREYLWFAAYQILGACDVVVSMLQNFGSQAKIAVDLIGSVVDCAWYVSLLGLVFSLMRLRRGFLFWAATSASIVAYVVIPSVQLLRWFAPRSPVAFDLAIVFTFDLALYAVIVVALARGARQGNRDAMILLFPIASNFLAWIVVNALQELSGFGNPQIVSLLQRLYVLSFRPFPWGVYDLTSLLCDLAILAVLVARFARSRREEQRMVAELEAARTIQQVLIPEEIPSIPGLALQCIYKPAGEVGGDFFQVLPNQQGGALIVIGDVSGKGMPAAMAVSLLVGTVRTLAHYTQSPAEILAAMNQRMLARSKDGFTTCLVLRIDSDGSATVANAGHLAPYLGAQELAVDSGFPLGLVAEAVYTETSFHLDMGQELTLITDGVAEARAKTGELFGFERTASISILSAEHIAATAKAFGQEDDITVLKIRRLPVAEPALASPAPVLSTSTDVSFNAV
jgi:hypothetical protein